MQLDSKFNFENVKFETLISTSKNQTAISSGSLIKQWQKDDRNYYHYKASDTINSMIAYLSARYTVKKEIYKGIQLELFHHPNHTQNVDKMIRVAKATIDYCSDNFGKYPHDYLRIVETSNHESSNGQAMPGVITINEKIFKRNVENPDSFNVVARVLIHEISHQWWGFLLTPKRVEGYMVLSESLAKYTESVILEKMYGKAMVNKLSASTISKYFSGRSYASETEPSLYLSNHQAYLGYSKGAIIMSAIKELIGEKS
ncbi:M1 family aminopeptidase [Polaribacter ponticola]|uniref:M1 family aminopeptidase n=1 Tax=Polaribacter ponticola TaxID=2978475 RepID=A0ABT5S6H5_9FLAO|nr:M1 family aminopeptidase [Polaribacter sp. MSW5]MDD7913705.1 M1 family aminopeptidase [Polaribacter sp. MSW5]